MKSWFPGEKNKATAQQPSNSRIVPIFVTPRIHEMPHFHKPARESAFVWFGLPEGLLTIGIFGFTRLPVLHNQYPTEQSTESTLLFQPQTLPSS